MKALFYSTLVLFIFSCTAKTPPPPPAPVVESDVDLTGFETSAMEGDAVRVAKTVDGLMTEEGYLLNGKKNGPWTIFNEKSRVKSVTTYLNGFKSGPHFEFNAQGRLDLHANYNGGNLHGAYAKYENGKPVILTNYNNAQIDGDYMEYTKRGKLHKQVHFKNGVQDGVMAYYDEEGKVTVSYVYKDGKKIKGGIVK